MTTFNRRGLFGLVAAAVAGGVAKALPAPPDSRRWTWLGKLKPDNRTITLGRHQFVSDASYSPLKQAFSRVELINTDKPLFKISALNSEGYFFNMKNLLQWRRAGAPMTAPQLSPQPSMDAEPEDPQGARVSEHGLGQKINQEEMKMNTPDKKKRDEIYAELDAMTQAQTAGIDAELERLLTENPELQTRPSGFLLRSSAANFYYAKQSQTDVGERYNLLLGYALLALCQQDGKGCISSCEIGSVEREIYLVARLIDGLRDTVRFSHHETEEHWLAIKPLMENNHSIDKYKFIDQIRCLIGRNPTAQDV